MPLHRRIADAVLTTDPVQRMRLSQAGLAMLLMAAGVVAMQYFVAVGAAPAGPVHLWTAASLGGMVVFFILIRSGWSRRLDDPSLTLAQMMYAISSGAAAYALVGEGRGGVFPIVMVVVAFGLFQLRPREFSAVGLFAVGLFGVVMATMAHLKPAVYPPRVELGHFLMIATMMPAMALLAARFSALRQRLRQQKHDLSHALARIQELATRDELTGLVNRRHMQTLIEQAHRRCARSGQSFCLAVLDVDHFKAVNDNHGHATGDEVLRSVAQEMQTTVRLSDTLARWGGEEFVLMMSDTHAPLARGGLERLRERVAQLCVLVPEGELRISVSAGLAEHRPGESVEDTLARADAALLEAKQQGRNRVVLAP
ncbi:diguanylate cyclase [Rubrivivax albus]|uniref:diguanylate cyclase n=1 Tax=Rubrivivax albus TaxID=2499835 RepID=A0A437JVI6_9BURK|nr:diguanylate cyclase [Rubrivivax albus]RVT51394.1 GGDEF domain-containing protein [Rubrivivax albus]